MNHNRGATCFEDLRTVDGVVYQTYREACYALGLLDDDKEYIDAIKEANLWGSDWFLRYLFSILILSESMSRPVHVWDSTWEILADDIQ